MLCCRYCCCCCCCCCDEATYTNIYRGVRLCVHVVRRVECKKNEKLGDLSLLPAQRATKKELVQKNAQKTEPGELPVEPGAGTRVSTQKKALSRKTYLASAIEPCSRRAECSARREKRGCVWWWGHVVQHREARTKRKGNQTKQTKEKKMQQQQYFTHRS